MKKSLQLIILSCFLISTGLIQAQSFSTPNTSCAYWGDLTSNVASLSVPVTNTTPVTISVVVEKIVNNLSQFHSSLFCFGIQCYDTSAYSSAVISFAGNSTETLLADLNKNGALGTSNVVYRIKDVNNPTDFIDIDVTFNITTTGISDISKSSTLSMPHPNPADRLAAVNYNLTGDVNSYSLEIYNILGNKVKQITFSEKNGVLLLPVAELNSGVYFYSLLSGNRVMSTNKLIVAHKN